MTLQGQARKAVKEARENIEKRTTHTPGPWTITRDIGGHPHIEAANGRMVAEAVYDESNEPTIEELEANARLISAAPDLLGALENVEKRLGNMLEGDYDREEICELIEELHIDISPAISKAKGE